MVNFCLMIILLSAIIKLLWQVNEELMYTIDDKLETALYTTIGFIMFLSDIIKPTKIELAFYKQQKELALKNACIILNKIRAEFETLKAAYNKCIQDYKKIVQQHNKRNIKLLPKLLNKKLFIEYHSQAA